MLKNFWKLLLKPSRKNPRVRRWQGPLEPEDRQNRQKYYTFPPIEKVVSMFELDDEVQPLKKSLLMSYPKTQRLIGQNTEATEYQDRVNQSLVALIKKNHPVVDVYQEVSGGAFSPFTYTDHNGKSLIVLAEDTKKEFPLLHSRMSAELRASNSELDDLIAAHEYAHAWDRGSFRAPTPKPETEMKSLTALYLENVLHTDGGRLPRLPRVSGAVSNRIDYARTPIEFPAVMTELSISRPEVVRELGDELPWVRGYLNYFWGNDFGDKVMEGDL